VIFVAQSPRLTSTSSVESCSAEGGKSFRRSSSTCRSNTAGGGCATTKHSRGRPGPGGNTCRA
jgi:hypothetical protein